jgi:hypothetical protein
LTVGHRAQVSCNLTDPDRYGPEQLYDAVAALVASSAETDAGTRDRIEGAELVGLLPAAVLAGVPRARWPELGLSADATVESRLS